MSYKSTNPKPLSDRGSEICYRSASPRPPVAIQKGSPLASDKKVNKLIADDIKTGLPGTVAKIQIFLTFGPGVRKSYKIREP